MTEKQSWTNNGSHRSDVSGRNGSYIPPTVRKKLYSYFNDIESELDEAYKQIRLLREGLRPTEDGKSKNTSISETFRRKNLNDKYSPNVKRSTPITQKIRDTYKISTNRLVNTLKSNQNIYDYSAEFVYKKHTDGLWDVCVSPYQSHIYATASVDKTARIWDGNLNICRYEYCGHFGGVNSIRFYPNNDLLCLTASGDGTAQLWKRENLKNIQEKLYDSDSKNSCLTYQNVYNKKNLQQKFECGSTVVISADFVDESQIVAACWSNCAYLFDIEKNRKTKTLEHSQQLTNVNCLKNSKIILTSSKDKSFKMWDLRDSERSSVDSNIHNQTVWSAIFCGTNKIACSVDDKFVNIYDIRNIHEPYISIRTNSSSYRIAYNERYDLLALPQENGHIRIYDINGNRLSRINMDSNRQGHKMLVTSVDWSVSEYYVKLLSAGFDSQLIKWHLYKSLNE